MGTRTHTEHATADTFQGYPQILNKVGDKITIKLKDVDGNIYTQTAEIIAFYKTTASPYITQNLEVIKAQRCGG